ncbi:DUF427 domain-containing protein [Amycolatopsis benzoatilytica]|uniref:DUF427 domain-containing protein n=1 Tax=Amycolatopsis benzoatilytica TaxID=346045 RepID=UPI000360CEDD|nr:DUF427 domain-containing protein [Amycolatopsis benzoatilytica]
MPQQLIPGPDHPITVEQNPARVVVKAGGQVIASTTRAQVLREASYPPVQYIPLEDVDAAVLSRTEHQTYCPYKGEASYYTLTAAPNGENAVWGYEKPYEAVAAIAGHVAFYPDRVEVEEIAE